MNNDANERAKMPQGAAAVLDSRSLEHSYATLIPVLKKGMRVLDVGCGTGAISAGIADAVGPDGMVIGIDNSDHLIAKGKQDHVAIKNLELIHTDLFTYAPTEKFDLIVTARVLQWLDNPVAALTQFKTWLQPGGIVSVLDYNHNGIEWSPAPPSAMHYFYKAFLTWRADAGMDNEIADHLPALFKQLKFGNIQTFNANEVYQHGDAGLGIWTKVAETRGEQMVQHGYVTETERLKAITAYNAWIENDAVSMTMKLNEVRANI